MSVGRYARHDLIPGWNQERLKAVEVVVAGVGALGGEVARILAMAGVGRLLIVDPDTVAISNLSRCVLFREADVGVPKVVAAARALRELAPDVGVRGRATHSTSGAGLSELRDADLVVSALDSVAARVELSARCAAAGAGLLDAGTRPWGGEVRHYTAGGACYACPLTPAQRAVQDDPWGCGEVASPQDAGASAAVSGVIGAWQAATALRLLFGLAVPALTRIDVVGGAQSGPGVARAPDCPCHDTIPADRTSGVPVTAGDTVADLLACVDAGEDVMTWSGFPSERARPGPVGALETFLRRAPVAARLTDIGVAPGEILPVVSGPRVTRYIELSTSGGEFR